MRFILQQKRIISGVATCVFAMFLCFAMIGTASASVCFLPDDLDCAEGDTSGFWPGDNDNITECDASYNSTTPRNACGVACERCNDRNSQYYGLFKCPPSTCNCNGFNDTNSVNECGDSCERCTITGDRNYGKYKCPDTRRACDDCNYTEEQAAQYMADDPCMECEPCNSNCCKGKWRCSVNRKCQQCHNEGYTLHKGSTELDALMNPKDQCHRHKCDPCPYDDEGDGKNWYKCVELNEQCDAAYYQYSQTTLETQYTQAQRNKHCDKRCDICYSPSFHKWHCDCFGYDYNASYCQSLGKEVIKDNSCANKCHGVGGDWYDKGCCKKYTDCNYNSDVSDPDNGLSCERCPGACPCGTDKWKCICSRRCSAVKYPDATAKTGAGWKSTSCTDCSGTYYKNECKSDYIPFENDCCKPNSCTGYNLPNKPSSASSTYEVCDKGCGQGKVYKCKSGYNFDNSKNECVKKCDTALHQYDTQAACNTQHSIGGCVYNEGIQCYEPICDNINGYYGFSTILNNPDAYKLSELCNTHNDSCWDVTVTIDENHTPECYHCTYHPGCGDIPSSKAYIYCKFNGRETSEKCDGVTGTGYFDCTLSVPSSLSKVELVSSDGSTIYLSGGPGISTQTNVRSCRVSPAYCKFYNSGATVVAERPMSGGVNQYGQTEGKSWSCVYEF